MELRKHIFTIRGHKAIDLCDRYGTPLYVYDADCIKEQYEKLVKAFKSTRMKVKYACKALTNQNILAYIKKLGAGLDTVSIQEVQLGLRAGFEPSEIIYTPNGVSFEEIKEAVSLGVVINIDNISILEQFGHYYGNSVPVCVRVNPHILAGGNAKISTGHIDSKFGISIYQMRHVERVVASTNLKVVGLHMHTGSEILDVGVFSRGAEMLFDCALQFKDLQFLDFGSGFKVPYKPNDNATDVAELGKILSKRFNAFCKEYGKELELWFEPGKYLVSEAGYFFAKVNVIKQTTATVFVGVDSGLNHLIRPMFYDSYHHIINVSNPAGTERIYTVTGYICETDTFAWDRKINEVREGDILCFLNAGAYGYMMASNYNSRPRPAEVMIYNGNDHLIRKRETLDDLLQNQVLVALD
ncbi:MAG: diaminopimelate decarboxylase [Chitinophagales bacterium]|nr:diaminopimelate decarboxylase [Chitinophagales bacterium]